MRALLLFGLLSFAYAPILAQGCSDAGFCTMGAMKPDQTYSEEIDFKFRSVEINYYKGETPLTPTVYSVHAEFTFGITERTWFQVKIPYQWAQGSFGNAASISDISISATRRFDKVGPFELQATLGGKIPTNKSNLDNDSLVLPMYYQPSLGSYDLVAGASLINREWLIATGVQVALTANENTYDPDDFFPWYPDSSYVEDYDIATNLRRGVDVMLRVERNFRFSNFNLSLGALPIYRITKDTRLNMETGEREKIDGTTGLALSVLAGAGYHININNSVKFIYGIKITDRDVNPDGLTRDTVMSLSFIHRF